MKNRKHIKNLSLSLLIIGVILLIIAIMVPKENFVVDDFEDADVSDWNETGFETTSYNATLEPRGYVANVIIKTGQTEYKYGSFQKSLSQNWEEFKNGKISFWIKFSDHYDDINRVVLSFGDVVSGGEQKNKANYYYKPKSNDWQLVSFKLNKPDSVLGDLYFDNIKKIRFNIEYGNDFYESGETFNVYIDDIKLIKLSSLAIILYALAISAIFISILLSLWKKIREKIRNFIITIGVLFILSILLMLFNLSFLHSLRIVFGSLFVLFLPGFVITYLFFKEIDVIERIALSFALSIAIVPLTIFYLNRIGMKINFLNSFLTILGIIIVSLTIKFIIEKKKRF